MNAITVNYAEIGDDRLPKSFGLAYTSHLTNGGLLVDGVSHIYSASVNEIAGTPYSLVQGRTFDYDKDIIVTTALPASTSLNALRGVKDQAWINFYQPTWDNDSFIWLNYKSGTGKFYTIIEKDNFPEEKEIGYSVHVSQILENENGCYNQVALTTKAALSFTAAADKVTVKHGDLILFALNSTLKILKENANDDNFTTLSNGVADSFQVTEYESYIDPAATVWAHEGTEVTPGIGLVSSSGVVKKYTKSDSGDQHLYQVLTGNNEAKFYRKRKDLIVNLTVTGDASNLGSAGAYSNGNESSYFDNNKLIIPNVKYGRTQIDIRNYFNDITRVSFNPYIINLYTGQQVNSTATITIGNITDVIMFTGFTSSGAVSQQRIEVSHGSLPKTYTLADMNTSSLSSVYVAPCSDYLKHEGSNRFKRQREVRKEYWEWDFLPGWHKESDNTYIDNSTEPYDKYWKHNWLDENRHEKLSETNSNFTSQTFYVTAYYSGIPVSVPVTATSNVAVALANQVVSFRGTYYVKDPTMQTLVKNLTGVDTSVASYYEEEIGLNWSTTGQITFYKKVTETNKDSASVTTTTYISYTATAHFNFNGNTYTGGFIDLPLEVPAGTVAFSGVPSVQWTDTNAAFLTASFGTVGSDYYFSNDGTALTTHTASYGIAIDYSGRWRKGHYQFF